MFRQFFPLNEGIQIITSVEHVGPSKLYWKYELRNNSYLVGVMSVNLQVTVSHSAQYSGKKKISRGRVVVQKCRGVAQPTLI